MIVIEKTPVCEAVGYETCRICDRCMRKWEYRLIGYCHGCYWIFFPKRPMELPPLRRYYKGGWQELVSPYEREKWRKPFDEVDDKIDRGFNGLDG